WRGHSILFGSHIKTPDIAPGDRRRGCDCSGIAGAEGAYVSSDRSAVAADSAAHSRTERWQGSLVVLPAAAFLGVGFGGLRLDAPASAAIAGVDTTADHG